MQQKKWQEKRFSVIKGDKWLTYFGKKNFGWTYEGTETCHDGYDVNTTYDSYGSHSTVTERFTTSMVFCRLKPYTGNIIFRFAEFLYNIVTFVRRTILTLMPLVLFAGIIWIITMVACDNMSGFNLLTEILITYALPIVGTTLALSFGLPLVGLILRKMFRIDEKNE
ncbi:MAG: hypothetical protein K2L42_02885 [Clostridia bacterium]|nr:hypothetical protein [Clostridia bacterium]